jgi:hypothetical protein
VNLFQVFCKFSYTIGDISILPIVWGLSAPSKPREISVKIIYVSLDGVNVLDHFFMP